MPAHVLVVDDDPDIVELVEATLVSEGFLVSTASDVPSAKSEIRLSNPDLVILDVMMEHHDSGHQLCRWIMRELKLPTIFLTARATDIDAIVGLELGADDYVAKPFNPRVLAARVRAVLRRREDVMPETRVETWVVRGFRIDETRMRMATVDGECSLSRIEFLILRCLAGGDGKVLSREQIISDVYAGTTPPSARTVDSHVRRLRSKMNDIGEDPIETVRGVGYRLRRS